MKIKIQQNRKITNLLMMKIKIQLNLKIKNLLKMKIKILLNWKSIYTYLAQVEDQD